MEGTAAQVVPSSTKPDGRLPSPMTNFVKLVMRSGGWRGAALVAARRSAGVSGHPQVAMRFFCAAARQSRPARTPRSVNVCTSRPIPCRLRARQSCCVRPPCRLCGRTKARRQAAAAGCPCRSRTGVARRWPVAPRMHACRRDAITWR